MTEFLICYADLIFCDHLPNLDHPSLAVDSLLAKKCRPNSLAFSTPAKLITLEEARSKHLLGKATEYGYIEVGGGPGNLPEKYHTVIDLPAGKRKSRFIFLLRAKGWLMDCYNQYCIAIFLQLKLFLQVLAREDIQKDLHWAGGYFSPKTGTVLREIYQKAGKPLHLSQ